MVDLSNLGTSYSDGPSKELLYEINQDMQDANNATITHAAILKNKIGKSKQLNELKNEAISLIKDIPNDMLEIDKWKNMKTKTSSGVNTIVDKTVSKIKKSNRKIGRKVKSLFTKKQTYHQNMDALEKLAKLKDTGVLTLKEFNSKKKKILKKI